MTNEEFYAEALLIALPIADAAIEPSQSKKRDGIAALAHEYAAASTAVFKRNRESFQGVS